MQNYVKDNIVIVRSCNDNISEMRQDQVGSNYLYCNKIFYRLLQ